MKLITGTRFLWTDGETYEVKDVQGGLVRASWVDPHTGKTQRGRPKHFTLSKMDEAKIVQAGFESKSAVVRTERWDEPEKAEPSPEQTKSIEHLLSLFSEQSTTDEW